MGIEGPKKITRRNILKGALVAVGLAVGGIANHDYKTFQEEELSQYAESPVFNAAIELMDKLNLEVPKDQLYGFIYPTTREMASRYKEARGKIAADSPASTLIVKQEKDPKSLIGRIKYRNRGMTDPTALGVYSPETSVVLTLPSYMDTLSPNVQVAVLYHEGLHFFFQKGKYNKNATTEEDFQRENMPNIGEILLLKSLVAAGIKLEDFYLTGTSEYNEAVAKGNKSIWENYLKKLYKLSED